MNRKVNHEILVNSMVDKYAGAEPELLLEGAPTACRGCLRNILIKFSEKPYEIKENLVREGRAGSAPLDPSLLRQSRKQGVVLECVALEGISKWSLSPIN